MVSVYIWHRELISHAKAFHWLSYQDTHQNEIRLVNFGLDLQYKKKKNSMVCVRERTKPTERQLLVGEVIANFCG
jgi:hypothetical protein